MCVSERKRVREGEETSLKITMRNKFSYNMIVLIIAEGQYIVCLLKR